MAVIRNQTRRISRAIGWLMTDEDGAAYTLSYVMVLPVLMLLVAMVVESALMLVAKLGTVHAAYVAARVASVHSSLSDWPIAEETIRRAGRQAMIPFASGSSGRSSDAIDPNGEFAKAYRQWSSDPVAQSYVQAKQHDASESIRVTVQRPDAWDAELIAEVTYDYPFRIPGIGRLIGEPDGDGYTFPLTTSVRLSNEGPQNDSQTLGIGYGTR